MASLIRLTGLDHVRDSLIVVSSVIFRLFRFFFSVVALLGDGVGPHGVLLQPA